MSDTYIPSGEESAQEQQFLQALVGQIQSRDACPIPKYASQIFCNFMGGYQTLAVNTAMLNSTVRQGGGYPGMSSYRGFFITTDGNGGSSNTIFNPMMGGNPAGSPTTGYSPFFSPATSYYPGTFNWAWPYNPTQIITQNVMPTPAFNFVTNYPNLAFYRQSFTPSPFYIFMPKWMKSFTVGIRLYSNLGVLQPILIASKTNAKWQDATINSSSAPDGSYLIESLSPKQFQDNVANPFYYISATIIDGVSFSSQANLLRKYFIVNSFNETPSGANSNIVASFSNYLNNTSSPYDFKQFFYAVEYWSNSALFDARPGESVILPFAYPTPNPPDTSRYPLANQNFSFQLPSPPSLPFRYYFRFRQAGSAFPITSTPFTGTFAVDYPAGYPTDPVSFTVEPASFDIAKVTIANYAAVNPQPAGFPTPPVGVPTFNSLDLSTMPLIGVDITAPL